MSWLKITKTGLYLMVGSSDKYVARVNCVPRVSDRTVLGISIPLEWFSGRDVPSTLIVDLDSPDPCHINSLRLSGKSGLSGKRIVLDPGHGEVKDGINDSGAVNSRLGLSERDLVHQQANQIAASLRQQGASVEIVESNTEMTLPEIGARGAGSDCFVSLHLNAFNNAAQYSMVLIDSNGTAIDKELAQTISSELEGALSIKSVGVKSQGLGVLRGVPLPVPAVLVESFFIDAVSDAKDMKMLLSSSADAISKGISRFLSPSA